MELQEYNKARNIFEKALKSSPGFILPYFNLGIVEKESNNLELSLDLFEKVLKIDPDYYDAWYQKGIVLNSLNRKEEALEAYNKVLEIVEKYDMEESELTVLVKEHIASLEKK
jgi:tetratricopeptide (TPR) repeat protein